MKLQTFSSIAVAVMAGMTLVACDWVDSAGGGETAQDTLDVANNQTEVLLDDVAVGDVVVINEKSVARLVISSQFSDLESFTWSDEPVAQGNLPSCAERNGFNTDFAADSLQEACTSSESCELNFEPAEIEEAAGSGFLLQIPELQASVGISYALDIEDESGRVDSSERTFCLIAINEAPEAGSDTFTVAEGALLDITNEQRNLLSNDTDDTDKSNQALEILPEALVLPQNAAEFDLGTDGSFTYRSALTNLTEDAFDNFTYLVTDGLFQSEGQVTIRIAATNTAPENVVDIPLLEATEDEFFSYDFSNNFSDPEGGDITFSLDPDTPLDDDTGLTLAPSGVLSGVPTEVDVDSWELTLIVSDGSQSTSANFTLVVEAAEELVPNRPPFFVVGSVFDQTVSVGQKIIDIEPKFTDPDNDVLEYSLAGTSILPPGVTLDEDTGVISGSPDKPGFYLGLRVRATDRSGASTLSSPAFKLTVKIAQ